MKKKQLSTILVIWILTFTFFGSINTNKVYSTPDPTVFVDPYGNTAAPTQTFSIKINVSDITAQKSLYGWEIEMDYNSSVLEVLDPVVEGPFLMQAGATWFYYEIDTPGLIKAGSLIFEDPLPSQGAVGSGALVIITFRVKTEGASALHLSFTRIYTFVGINPVDIPHSVVDGFFKYPMIHDIAVINVFVSPTQVTAGQPVDINATVENQGDLPETFTVNFYRNLTLVDFTVIGTKQVTVTNGISTNATFTWDTTGVAAGNYTIKAEVPQILGETDTGDNTLTEGWVLVIVPPTASFTYTPSNPIVGETITFDASASNPNGGTITNYKWTFGDTNTATTANPVITHSYTSPGAYTVILNVTDSEGLWDTHSKLVTVGILPYASFTFSPATLQVDQLVTFNSTSYDPDGTIVSWKWDLNGDSIIDATTENTTRTYNQFGTYTVTLNVTDNDDLWNITSQQVIIGKRSSSITINAVPSTIKLEDSTTITGSITPAIPDTTSVDVTIWYKETAESTWANLTTVTTNSTSQYTYTWTPTDLGTYDLKANWTGTTQTQPAESATATVKVSEPPEAKFTYEPASPNVNDQVTFDASTSKPKGAIKTYTWNFGDANTTAATSSEITHTYTLPGEYNVTLTVTTTEGFGDATWQLITVLQTPIAIFMVTPEVTPEGPLVGQTLTFNATESNDPDGTISSYTWDFGDGTNGTGPIIQHKYTKAGTYEVKLTVEDNNQLIDIATTTVQVGVHDIAVISVKSIPSMVIRGEQATITVIVANKGTFTQTFDVSAYYETTLIDTQEVSLLAGEDKPITFTWNTTSVTEGEFTIRVEAEVVSDETETTNNQLIGETVTVQAEETPPPPPSSDIFLYVVAAAVITILAAAGALYFFKYRK